MASAAPSERKSNSLAARCQYKRYFFSFVHYNLEMPSLCIPLLGFLSALRSRSRLFISVFLTFIGFGDIKRTAQYLFSCHFAEKSEQNGERKQPFLWRHCRALSPSRIHLSQGEPRDRRVRKSRMKRIKSHDDGTVTSDSWPFSPALPPASPALRNK